MLEDDYIFEEAIINAADYGVPQIRKRSIFLLTRKDVKNVFKFLTSDQIVSHINLSKSIGHLPSLDPKIQEFKINEQLEYFPQYLKEEEGLKISKWHRPPVHKLRHVGDKPITSEGKSTLLNDKLYPKNKDGSRIRGYKNTYKRQFWNLRYTVTTYNGAICSQDNVHPGRPIKINNDNLFFDARVFSIYELLITMSIDQFVTQLERVYHL